MSAQSMFATEGILKKPRIPKEFLGAFKKGHRYSSREYIDEEFSQGLLQLADAGVEWAREAIEWLSKFNNEYYKCVFTKKNSDLIKGKRRRKERYNSQNARQRDALISGKHWAIENVTLVFDQSEDDLIEAIDLKREIEKSNKQ